MGIGGVDAIDLFSLSGAEGFVGIQAPDTFQEALPPQDLMQSRDAVGEIVRRVEKGCVGIGNFGAPLQQIFRSASSSGHNGMALLQKIDGASSPYRPVAQKAAHYTVFPRASVDLETMGSEKIHGDIVIIAGVERDVSAGFGDGADDIQGLVTVEWRNLDGDNIFNLGELAPEFVGKYAAAHGRLQVKTNERYDLRHFSGVSYEGRVLRIFHGGQAQQARAVSQIREQLRFCYRLRCRSANTSDAD